MPESFVVQRETQIAAPRASVFAFLTDPEKIVQWMGSEAVTETHPGGLYLLKGVGSATARGHSAVVPVHRLAYSFGWEGNDEVPPGSGLIEIDLIEHDGARCCATQRASQRRSPGEPCQGLDPLYRQADQGGRRPGSRPGSGTERHARRVSKISVGARIAGRSILFLQHRHMEAAADFHALPPVERNRRVIAGEDVQEWNLAARYYLARDRG